MNIYHEHHIIPKHMGGTNDRSNIVKITIEEHAEAHRILYETYGKKEDFLAWKGLEGIFSKKEIISELYKLGRRNASLVLEEIYGPNWCSKIGSMGGKVVVAKYPNHMFNMSLKTKFSVNKELHMLAIENAKSEESRLKRKNTFKNIKHQQGSKNSQFGTCWITNGSENKKIKKEELDFWISKGYYKGRIAGVV